jgi:hypothetical protein
MKDSILPKLEYSYNLEGQKTRQDPKVDDEISSKTTEHRDELVASSPPNWRKRERERKKETERKCAAT